MAPYFTKRIETYYGIINFYFNRIYTLEGSRYNISCIYKSITAYIFNMEEIRGKWILVILNTYPKWNTKLVTQLRNAIPESSTQ
jgi:hypothetical protein